VRERSSCPASRTSAQSCGTPVLAFDAGGAREAVAHGRTGHLYRDPAPGSLADAMRRFDTAAFDPDVVRAHAERFDLQAFDRAIGGVLDRGVRRVGRARLRAVV
jgi:glycosyltransferase involved in cell wall biosynthesis